MAELTGSSLVWLDELEAAVEGGVYPRDHPLMEEGVACLLEGLSQARRLLRTLSRVEAQVGELSRRRDAYSRRVEQREARGSLFDNQWNQYIVYDGVVSMYSLYFLRQSLTLAAVLRRVRHDHQVLETLSSPEMRQLAQEYIMELPLISPP